MVAITYREPAGGRLPAPSQNCRAQSAIGLALWAVIILGQPLTVALGQFRSASAGPDLARVRKAITDSWAALRSIELSGREYPSDDSDAPRPGASSMEFRFSYQSGGKWAYAVWSVKPDGAKTLLADVREDGRKQYSLFDRTGYPGVLDRVQIQTQRSSTDRYDGGMQVVLWLWIPAGMPPATHLNAGGSLRAEQFADGTQHIVLHSTHRGLALRCELDPEHDWLPRRVQLGDDIEYVATEFRLHNGRWFYAKGHQIRKTPKGGPIRTAFELDSVTINENLPTERFAPPRLQPGVIVADVTARSRIEGGSRAREAFEQRYPLPGPSAMSASREQARSGMA